MHDDFDDNVAITEELILEKCPRYLARLREVYESTGNRVCFKRGSPKIYNGDIQTFRNRKAPMNTSVVLHNITNEWFDMKFGIKAREECLFVTNSTLDSKEYGTPHYVFPIGGFSTIHSNSVKDLYLALNHKPVTKALQKHGIDTTKYTVNNNTFLQELYLSEPEAMESAIYELLEDNNYRKGKSAEALLSNNEVMLKTKRFIMVEINERFSEFMNDVIWY